MCNCPCSWCHQLQRICACLILRDLKGSISTCLILTQHKLLVFKYFTNNLPFIPMLDCHHYQVACWWSWLGCHWIWLWSQPLLFGKALTCCWEDGRGYWKIWLEGRDLSWKPCVSHLLLLLSSSGLWQLLGLYWQPSYPAYCWAFTVELLYIRSVKLWCFS